MTLFQSYLLKEDELCFTVKMVQGQVEAYKIDHQKFPSLEELKELEYLPKNEEAVCPNGDAIQINADGSVTPIASSGTGSES